MSLKEMQTLAEKDLLSEMKTVHLGKCAHEKNGLRKQYRKPNNRKHRFNGKLRFAQYVGETERE